MITVDSLYGRNVQSSQAKSIQLKPGQVFQGQIQKFFPHQLAALRIGQLSLTAKLQVALTAGKTYWFQVESDEGIPRLQVLDDNTVRGQASTSQNSALHVLQQFGLAATKTNELLVRQLAAEQVPFTKEDISQGAALLRQASAGDKHGIEVLKSLLQRNLPLTLETFQAMRAVQYGEPLAEQLSSLMKEATSHSQSGQTSIFLEALRKHFQQTVVPQGGQNMGHLLAMFAQHQDPIAHEGAHQLLKRVGLIDPNSTKEQVYEQFKQAVIHPNNRNVVEQLWPFLANQHTGNLNLGSIEAKTLFELLIPRVSQSETAVGQERLQQLLSLLNPKAQPSLMTERLRSLFGQYQQLQASEKQVMVNMLQMSVPNESVAEEGRSQIALQLARLVSSLGIQYENELLQLFQGQQKGGNEQPPVPNHLKQLLLQAQQMDLPQSIKDRAEAILQRMTGQQLLAVDQMGPLHQIALQLPLRLGEFQTNMTVQWEGRKREDGKIDPEHCRILFYLELEQLQETIVDMQIQNKVVTLQIFNEQPRPSFLFESMQPLLKEKLKESQFELSSLTWKEIKESPVQGKRHNPYQRVDYQGVDIRV
ncbi:hypothetical protein [Desertibacillus haloalkaliphilus]|uniref:hypothetical protein n=1 Tax=Desertibacillus haloalkaliphilus TaxID=1328930 RepID=UPI001C27CC64|nr:hypothetical protein [Desertibacillus haloalkaliphilus]MBU8907030.1 hypothetical protein [Desertibacillus haloalkaliphilus]